MSRYLIRFTPMEPYFFGSERTLNYTPKPTTTSEPPASQYQNLYFVRGENTPLQTTLLGALRFLLLQKHGRKPDNFGKLSKEELDLIGKNSFIPEPQEGEAEGFGVIQTLSPVFLTDEAGVHYIPVPMDHNLADEKKNDGGKIVYSPFRHYNQKASKDAEGHTVYSGDPIPLETADGKKLYTEEFDVKKGTASGFMSLADGTLQKDLFSGVLRVGINRREQENGFFKKEYKRLKTGFSFAVYCELDEEWGNMPEMVFLGQGHSAFRVKAKEADKDSGIERETLDFLKQRHPLFAQEKKYSLLYCLGDAFMLTKEEKGLYDGLLFAVTGVRDFRSMQTRLADGPHLIRSKQPVLYHLMKAGSVLIAENDDLARAWRDRYRNEYAKTVGFNTFVELE